jgi:hypothetical protein
MAPDELQKLRTLALNQQEQMLSGDDLASAIVHRELQNLAESSVDGQELPVLLSEGISLLSSPAKSCKCAVLNWISVRD